MKIHKEGYRVIACAALLLFLFSSVCAWLLPPVFGCIIGVLAFVKLIFVISFFRLPARDRLEDPKSVYSPADGTVVAIEEVYEPEYFNEPRMVVSIFMSIWNVHVNWFPVAGKVDYFRHHNGEFRVAWHPKSSEENERTTTVVEMASGEKVLFRQIAGFVARRIVSYANEGAHVDQNSQCGFIKFGSRVDIYLPLDAQVQVKLNEKVVGTQTVLAKFNS